MSHPNNARAREANAALQAFRNETGDDPDTGDNDVEQVVLIYLLADLRHLCDAQGWDFGQLDRQAYRAYVEDHDGNPNADASFAEAVQS